MHTVFNECVHSRINDLFHHGRNSKVQASVRFRSKLYSGSKNVTPNQPHLDLYLEGRLSHQHEIQQIALHMFVRCPFHWSSSFFSLPATLFSCCYHLIVMKYVPQPRCVAISTVAPCLAHSASNKVSRTIWFACPYFHTRGVSFHILTDLVNIP